MNNLTLFIGWMIAVAWAVAFGLSIFTHADVPQSLTALLALITGALFANPLLRRLAGKNGEAK